MGVVTGRDSAHLADVAAGERFEFGENWRRFLSVLNEERIIEAERSLQSMLSAESLRGRTFLDVGCGSGLFSLAALRLGAQRVRSFDFDPASVGCALELRRRFAPDPDRWEIGQGSALDRPFLDSLGTYDIVYAWGVLHHTGSMWEAIDNTVRAVAPGGSLFVSIYNDQGPRSRMWRWIKRAYNRLPHRLRVPFTIAVMAPREALSALLSLARLRPLEYVRAWTGYGRSRGMSRWHDMIDWVGGYPFEVATPEAVFNHVRSQGLQLERLVTCGGSIGCNQFVFSRPAPQEADAERPVAAARRIS